MSKYYDNIITIGTIRGQANSWREVCVALKQLNLTVHALIFQWGGSGDFLRDCLIFLTLFSGRGGTINWKQNQNVSVVWQVQFHLFYLLIAVTFINQKLQKKKQLSKQTCLFRLTTVIMISICHIANFLVARGHLLSGEQNFGTHFLLI